MPSIRKHPPSPTDQPRTVRHRRIDGDGVTEVVTIFDHLYQEDLPPRCVERIDQTLEDRESNDFPERDDMGQRERGHAKRLDGRSRLCPHQQLAAIEALNPDARKWRERKRRNQPCKTYDAEQK